MRVDRRNPEDVIKQLQIQLRLAQDQSREFQRDAAKRDKYLVLAHETMRRFVEAGQDLYRKAMACECCHCGTIDAIRRIMNPNNRDPKSLGGFTNGNAG